MKLFPAVVGAIAVGAVAASAPAFAQRPTLIRTGGPSRPGEPKIAVVASDRNLSGHRFSVASGDRVVLRGRLRRAVGSPAPWHRAYTANLTGVRKPGRYVVRVAGWRSRPWNVRAGRESRLIDLVLNFFRSNSDGTEPSPIHAPSHLHDATIKGGPHDGQRVDMTGGWMDAGDMLHFTQNAAFATAQLEAAARLDPRDAGAIGAEADVGVRWLEKLHPFRDVFVVQIGDHRDHNRGFSDPALDDSSGKPGIAYRLAYHWGGGVGGDIGGKVATALALAADRASGARRSQLVGEAEQWYAAGKAAHRPTPRVIDDFYVDTNWKDSMAAGAAALYRVTGNSSYLADARSYLRQYGIGDVMGYYEMSPFAAADLCGALGAPPLGGPAAKRQGCSGLRSAARQVRAEARRNAFGPSGFLSWGTTQTVAAGGAEAQIAAEFAGFQGGRRIAAAGRDYLLGLNPWGASFVAGFGPRSPRKIHSWASVFGDGLPRGAVVGGPAPRRAVLGQHVGRPRGPFAEFNSRRYVYEDRRADYVTSEPTIDSAASTVLLLAALHGAG